MIHGAMFHNLEQILKTGSCFFIVDFECIPTC